MLIPGQILCLDISLKLCHRVTVTISGNTRDAGVDLIIHRAPRVAICIAVNRWTFKNPKNRNRYLDMRVLSTKYLYK